MKIIYIVFVIITLISSQVIASGNVSSDDIKTNIITGNINNEITTALPKETLIIQDINKVNQSAEIISTLPPSINFSQVTLEGKIDNLSSTPSTVIIGITSEATTRTTLDVNKMTTPEATSRITLKVTTITTPEATTSLAPETKIITTSEASTRAEPETKLITTSEVTTRSGPENKIITTSEATTRNTLEDNKITTPETITRNTSEATTRATPETNTVLKLEVTSEITTGITLEKNSVAITTSVPLTTNYVQDTNFKSERSAERTKEVSTEINKKSWNYFNKLKNYISNNANKNQSDSSSKSNSNDSLVTPSAGYASKMKSFLPELPTFSVSDEDKALAFDITKRLFNFTLKGYKMIDSKNRTEHMQTMCKHIHRMPSSLSDEEKLQYINGIILNFQLNTIKIDTVKGINNIQTLCDLIGKSSKDRIVKKLKETKNYFDVNSMEHSTFMENVTKVFGSKIQSLFICTGLDWYRQCKDNALDCLKSERPNICIWDIACGGKFHCTPKSSSISNSTTTNNNKPGAARYLFNSLLRTTGLDCLSLKECLDTIGFPWTNFVDKSNKPTNGSTSTTAKPH